MIEGANGTSINDWHHIALSRIGNDWKIYRDGEEIASGTSPVAILNTNNNVKIAKCDDCDSSTHTIDGKLDDLMIFNKGLTSSEVKAIYSSQR
jgi:hypothetical protein